MIQLFKYKTLDSLNEALGDFSKQEIEIKKVKLLTVKDKVEYYVLVDTIGYYQPDKRNEAYGLSRSSTTVSKYNYFTITEGITMAKRKNWLTRLYEYIKRHKR